MIDVNLGKQVGETVELDGKIYRLVEEGLNPDENGRGRISVWEDEEGKRYQPSIDYTVMIALPEGC